MDLNNSLSITSDSEQEAGDEVGDDEQVEETEDEVGMP